MRTSWLCFLIWLVVGTGCSFLFDPGAEGDGGEDASTFPVDASSLPLDGSGAGASGIDGGGSANCPDASGAVAHYPVDGDDARAVLRDQGPNPVDGSAVPLVVTTAGPEGCGDALRFQSSSGEAFVEIPDDDKFDLATGSLDLWVKPVELPSDSDDSTVSILSRDAAGNGAGHLNLYQHLHGGEGSFFVLRIQGGTTQTPPGTATHRCSEEMLTPGQWYHVGVNFGAGGAELYVDGELQERTTQITLNTETHTCGDDEVADVGLESDLSWLLGASGEARDAGGGGEKVKFFAGGAIDHLRISDQRLFP